MTLDYTSHPTQLVEGGKVKGSKSAVTIDDLKKAIPAHCFQPSYKKSFFYLFRDLLFVLILGWAAVRFIGYPSETDYIPLRVGKWISWLTYGYFQGLVFTGLWVIAHECGHGGFSTNNMLNDTVGFILHSALITPYFAWKSTHRRHHIYANNLAKDHNYVPPQRQQYLASLKLSDKQVQNLSKLEDLSEDVPLAVFVRIVIQQVFGWPWYLINNITASEGSLYDKQSDALLGNSHFLPTSTLFRKEEAHLILLSDLGIAATIALLTVSIRTWGFSTVALLYIQPYMWVNHWIVMITYLHHTHPNLPKYQPEAWTFLKGATATIDREFGWVGKHLLHNICDYHVIHHLFSRIPQYHAEEATKAIIPLLGDAYHNQKSTWLFRDLWDTFKSCQYIESDESDVAKDRAFWFKAGPSPPPEISMKYRGWF